MKKLLLPLLAIFLFNSFKLFAAAGDTTHIRVQDHVDMVWYGNYDQIGYFPLAGKTYNKAILIATVGCASGGCSDWDYDVHFQIGRKTGAKDSTVVSIDSTTNDTTWNVFDVREFYEMGRMITPYGGYMRTSSNGFTNAWEHRFRYDISDFLPLLNDSVMIRSFYSGWSSGFDITFDFYFIEGTPPREVKSIQNIMQKGASYSDAATFNNINTPAKNLSIPTDGVTNKLRCTVTGHGFDNSVYCAEFCPRTYFLKINGNTAATKTIWKDDCGMNPIYPQGGTWIYDRADWCPGTAASSSQYDITPYVAAGSSYDFDFDVENFTWTGTQAPSYSITEQLVSYGPYNFKLDAELYDIVAPNSHEEHVRYNPVCNNPIVTIRNNGELTLTEADIKYWVEGGTPCFYVWTGNLKSGEMENVTLPPFDWAGLDPLNPRFHAEISWPNHWHDEWELDNHQVSSFELPDMYDAPPVFWFRTNNHPTDNRYVVYNEDGDTLRDFSSTANATLFKDTFDFPNGCYVLDIYDSEKDGMKDWPVTQGNGLLQIKTLSNATRKTLKIDFGYRERYNFMMGYELGNGPAKPACEERNHTGINELNKNEGVLNVFPNPATQSCQIKVKFEQEQNAQLSLVNALGETVFNEQFKGQLYQKNVNVTKLPSGYYLVKLIINDKVYSEKLIVN